MNRKTLSENFHSFDGQNFLEIRKWCVDKRVYFEDPYFKVDSMNYEWRRPGEIVPKPKLFVDGPCRFDVLQGQIGDCWILASIATLAMYQDLVKVVVPTDQDFTTHYAGIFHFHFWRFGKWFDVVIDDRLPTIQGKLVFTHSTEQNEFWTALLEKAYCKVLGESYTAAEGGNMCEALEDFTGGVVEQILLRIAPKDFPQLFLRAVEKQSLIGCFIDNIPGTIQTITPLGLVRGHCYSVTGVNNVQLTSGGSILLVRLRNPWGRFEWIGPWSDGSPEWKSVPDKLKKQLNVVNQDDGEFWMSYNDFITNFEWVDMCHLNPDAYGILEGKSKGSASWELTTFRDHWVPGITAGGSKALHMNPQIRFTLQKPSILNAFGQCSVLIALIQKTPTRKVEEYSEIGYKIYRLYDNTYFNTNLDKKFFMVNQSVAQAFVKRTREVAGRFSLEPGSYCIIPFTFEAGRWGEFLVRIYSEKRTNMYQVQSSVTLSEARTRNDGTSRRVGDELKEREILQKYFETLSKGTDEIGWKNLKEMLNFAMKNEMSKILTGGGVFGFIVNSAAYLASYVYSTIFGPKTNTKNAFNAISPEGLPIDICRSFIAYFDDNHSGTIVFDEFLCLWQEIKKWKSIYEKHTVNNETYLSSSNLKPALEAAGFHLNNQILKNLVYQYGTEDGKVPFDEFMCCTLKLKTMSEIFWSKDEHGFRKADFTLQEFLEKTLYT